MNPSYNDMHVILCQPKVEGVYQTDIRISVRSTQADAIADARKRFRTGFRYIAFTVTVPSTRTIMTLLTNRTQVLEHMTQQAELVIARCAKILASQEAMVEDEP